MNFSEKLILCSGILLTLLYTPFIWTGAVKYGGRK